jgi:hypothetical protein
MSPFVRDTLSRQGTSHTWMVSYLKDSGWDLILRMFDRKKTEQNGITIASKVALLSFPDLLEKDLLHFIISICQRRGNKRNNRVVICHFLFMFLFDNV